MGEFEEDVVLKQLRRDKTVSKETRRRNVLNHIKEKYGYLLDLPNNCLPPEHKASLGGGLRCFSMAWLRDKKTSNKILNKKGKGTKVRCGNPAKKGSFYCKKHGGANVNALVHGKMRNPVMAAYRTDADIPFGNLLELYLQDETVMDIKPELASLRVALNKYVKQLVEGAPLDIQDFMSHTRDLMDNELTSDVEKYFALKTLFDRVESLTNGHSLDRLARIIETISRVVERLQKAANSEQYAMTPDGFRIFLRAIVDVIQNNVTDEEALDKVKNQLMAISVNTKGRVGNYHGLSKVKDAEYTVEEK